MKHGNKHTAHRTQHTEHSTQHIEHSTQHTAHSTQHTAHSTQHTAHSTQHTAHMYTSFRSDSPIAIAGTLPLKPGPATSRYPVYTPEGDGYFRRTIRTKQGGSLVRSVNLQHTKNQRPMTASGHAHVMLGDIPVAIVPIRLPVFFEGESASILCFLGAGL